MELELAWSIGFVALMVTAMVSDVSTRRIPNGLVLAGLTFALALRATAGLAIVDGLTGAALALAIVFPLFTLRALGGGDVKLIVALGAFTGPSGLFSALLASAVAGGVLGIAVALRRGVLLPAMMSAKDLVTHAAWFGRRGERVTLESPAALTVPYGAAIATGSLYAWFVLLEQVPW